MKPYIIDRSGIDRGLESVERELEFFHCINQFVGMVLWIKTAALETVNLIAELVSSSLRVLSMYCFFSFC